MDTRPQQLLLVADGESVVLPPEVAATAASAMAMLILQMTRVEVPPERAGELRKGDSDDPRF